MLMGMNGAHGTEAFGGDLPQGNGGDGWPGNCCEEEGVHD